MTLLAQISDLHLDGGPLSLDRATRVMDYLRRMPTPVDALLVTGDIADHGAPSEYADAARILAAPFPVLMCPGNHDTREAFREGLFGRAPTGDPINGVHHIAGTSIVMCDSSIPGRHDGLLDADTLAWLDATLADLGDAPSVIAFHHPPISIHHPLPDTWPLREPDRLAALIAKYPNVVAILTGHAHTGVASRFAGRPLIVGPAVVWTLRMPWEAHEAPADPTQPPGIAFHFIDSGGITTYFRVLI